MEKLFTEMNGEFDSGSFRLVEAVPTEEELEELFEE